MNPLRDGWTTDDVETVLARADPRELVYVPIAVALDPPDCAWSASVCVRLSAHADDEVRANAVLGLGHLARTCGRHLDEATVRPILEFALRDPSDYVRAQADAAAGDAAHFLGWRIARD